jgi:hypothetical protein
MAKKDFQKEHIALEMTEKAKNNIFDRCIVYGKVSIAGTGNKMKRTIIYQFTQKHPIIFWITLIASVLTIMGFFIQILILN